MIVNNLYILSFISLYKSIISRESLGYNPMRLRPDELADLTERSSHIVAQVIESLPSTVKVIGSMCSDVMFTGDANTVITIPAKYSDLKYEVRFYPVGIYIDPVRYVLWNGQSIEAKGSILERRDIPRVCKVLFCTHVKDRLLNTTTHINMSLFSFDDFVFKLKITGDRVLDHHGKRVDAYGLTISDIHIDQYIKFVDSIIERYL